MSSEIPPPAQVAACGALFLDFDGTLVPIAPRPDAVQVPLRLIGLLRRLHDRLHGAIAIVSGRELPALDRLLAPLVLPAAGEHGLTLRPDPAQGAAVALDLALPDTVREAAEALSRAHPGTLLETKRAGLALHYRASPASEAALLAAMHDIVAHHPRMALLHGSKVIELRPRGIDKGMAVHALMARAPFARRVPVFIGDDTTDEDGIAAARALGGHGLHMARTFRTPDRLAEWLHAITEAADAAAA